MEDKNDEIEQKVKQLTGNSRVSQAFVQLPQSFSNNQQQLNSFNFQQDQQISQQQQLVNIKKICNNCQNEDGELFKCSRCKQVYYCGLPCQQKNWKQHKIACEQVPTKPPKDRKIDHFNEVQQIGYGNFSDIYRAKCKYELKYYAIKQICRKKLAQVRKEADLLMEKHSLYKLSGNNYVIQLYNTFKDLEFLYFQMEYVPGGELWNELKEFGLIQYSLIKYFVSHLINALQYIHGKGIIHRDLKTENVMLTLDKKIKLIDFGTSRDIIENKMGSGNSAKGKKVFEHWVGTPNFMSPEQIRNRDSNEKSDIWALGNIIMQMVIGFPPFMGKSDYLIFQKSLTQEPKFPKGLFTDELKELVLWILTKDINKRPTLEEIKQHSFFNDINFNNIPSYEYFLDQKTQFESFLLNVKNDFLNQYPKETKQEVIVEYIQIIKNQIDKDDFSFNGYIFTPQERERLLQWLKHMEKQLLNHYKLVEFEYDDNECDLVENREDYTIKFDDESDNKIQEQEEISSSEEDQQQEQVNLNQNKEEKNNSDDN